MTPRRTANSNRVRPMVSPELKRFYTGIWRVGQCLPGHLRLRATNLETRALELRLGEGETPSYQLLSIRCGNSPRGTVTCSPEARCLSAKASALTSFSPM